MDTFLKFLVIFAFPDLTGINLSYVEKNPVDPVLKRSHLHLHVHQRTVFQFDHHVQNS